MKGGSKAKPRSAPRRVREVATKYRASNAPGHTSAKCRMLCGNELGALVEQMIAAKEANNRPLLRRLRRDFMNGFYGETRA